MDPTVLVAIIGAAGMVVAAVVGFMARPRMDKRNNKDNPGDSAQVMRDECKEIRDALHQRFDRLEDKIVLGFRDVTLALNSIREKT